jgi:hypothetical protein
MRRTSGEKSCSLKKMHHAGASIIDCTEEVRIAGQTVKLSLRSIRALFQAK